MSTTQLSIKDYFKKDGVQSKFAELLGEKSTGFITSLMQVVNSNNKLKTADPASVYNAAAMGAVLDLPINNNIGYAWIVPYGGKAQFQIGWKGFVQLAKRSGQYLKINAVVVYENQFKSYDRLSEELICNFKIKGSGKVVGYAAYFKEVNGFSKTVFWTIEEVKEHARKYSKTYGKKYNNGQMFDSPWNDELEFHKMGKKTVLKHAISNWGTMSLEMQKAVAADQSVVDDFENNQFSYPDNDNNSVKDAVNADFEDVTDEELTDDDDGGIEI